MYRFFDSISVLVAESRWNFHLNAKVIHSSWIFDLVGRNANSCALGRQLGLLQILRCVESRTGA